jgi:hypothetical protein
MSKEIFTKSGMIRLSDIHHIGKFENAEGYVIIFKDEQKYPLNLSEEDYNKLIMLNMEKKMLKTIKKIKWKQN